MLLDLELLNVVDCKGQRAEEHNTASARHRLHADTTAKASPGDHEDANDAHDAEKDDEVTIKAVEQDGLVANDGDELKAGKKPARYHAGKVHDQTDPSRAGLVKVTLPRERAGSVVRVAEDAVKVEVHHAGEGEPHHATRRDDKEGKVVALFEANGVVDLARQCDEAVGGRFWVRGGRHGGLGRRVWTREIGKRN